MIPQPPFEQSAPVNMLAETHKLYRWTAEELIRIINALKSGESGDVKGAASTIRELRTALGWALDEGNNVEKIGKTLAAAAGAAGDGYDLAAARDEVGRRLARLRAARNDGGVSGKPE